MPLIVDAFKAKLHRCINYNDNGVVTAGKRLVNMTTVLCDLQAGGAYTLNTGSSVTVRSTIRRLREQTEL